MLTLNTTRTFPTPVTVYFIDEDGKSQKGTFTARFKVLPTDELTDESNSDKRLLDLVLDSVDEDSLNLKSPTGERLTGDSLLNAAKADPAISSAMMSTYNEKIAKKNLKRT